MYYTTKGLVLNAKIKDEHDKLITVYSYEWGKIQAVVPSAKKIAAKLSSSTEPLTESEFMVFSGHSSVRPKITGANIIENNTKVKTDFKRNLYALYAAEISDKFAPFNLKNTVKYSLIARIWEILGACKYPKRALTAFALRFLKLSGYAFSDYLKNSNAFVNKDIEKAIKRLSNCSGDDIDMLEGIEEEKIWNCVETYLTNYIRRPALSIFLQKIGKKNFQLTK
ncbi:MAG: DNA repair protein RecO [Endomicrobium sp.]|nr:DNA repair protein RecO [Endomicrobium sp.]